jgi:ABC-type multidrug transport system permease subunit
MTRSRPISVQLLVLLVLLQGLSGLLGGTLLVMDPTGEALQLPLGWLDGSPFADYLVPGLILLTVLGVPPMVIAVGLWTGRRWSWFGALAVGVGLMIWIWVEILVIGYHADPPLQLIYGAASVGMLILVLLPSVREFFLPEVRTAP